MLVGKGEKGVRTDYVYRKAVLDVHIMESTVQVVKQVLPLIGNIHTKTFQDMTTNVYIN